MELRLLHFQLSLLIQIKRIAFQKKFMITERINGLWKRRQTRYF